MSIVVSVSIVAAVVLLVVSARRRSASLLALPPAFAAVVAAGRTRVLAPLLAAALVGGTALFALHVDRQRAADERHDKQGTTVVVIDISGSVVELGGVMVAQTLRAMGELPAQTRGGLVLFSSSASTALPLDTPARELKTFARFFDPPKLQESGASQSGGSPLPSDAPASMNSTSQGGYFSADSLGGQVPFPLTVSVNPWADAFDGGTVISTGVLEAERQLKKVGLRGSRILLLSDLENSPEDEIVLYRALVRLRRAGVTVRALALPPTTYSMRYDGPVTEAFGPDAVVTDPRKLVFGKSRQVAKRHTSSDGKSNFLLVTLLLTGLAMLVFSTSSLQLPRLGGER